MIWKKITHGYVVQRFDDKKCTAMHFTAGDDVICESESGQLLNNPEHDYQPFDMTLENLDSISDLIQSDLITLLENKVGDKVDSFTIDAVWLIVSNRLNK